MRQSKLSRVCGKYRALFSFQPQSSSPVVQAEAGALRPRQFLREPSRFRQRLIRHSR
jgi:hypothetical protein